VSSHTPNFFRIPLFNAICFSAIWTANGNNEEAALEIGHKLRDALRLGRNNSLQYQLHKDTMVKQGSNVKSIYTL